MADGYERRWRHYLAVTRERALQALAPKAGERILDAACGAGGLFAELAAESKGIALTGLDASTAMLEQARERLPVNVRLVEGRLERLPLEAAAFDAVTCLNALHFCPEPAPVLAEFHRVLAPGGRLVVIDWRRNMMTMPLLGYWLRANKRPMGRLLRTHELAALARSAGFTVDRLERFHIRPAWAMMTLCAHRTD